MLKPTERLALINQAFRRLRHRADPLAQQQRRRLFREILQLRLAVYTSRRQTQVPKAATPSD